MSKIGAIIGLSLGMILLFLSYCWPVESNKGYWTDEQQQELTQAIVHAHGNPESESAKKHVFEKYQEVEAARGRARLVPNILYWAGIVCAAVGGGLVLVKTESE